jgi:hypothetical protein
LIKTINLTLPADIRGRSEQLLDELPIKSVCFQPYTEHLPMTISRLKYVLISGLLILPLSAHALRCGTQLIQPGQLEIQVREKCGDPVSEELIGYTLRGAPPGLRGEREYKIEQWIYGPDQGYYHVLIFEAGRLHDIDKTKQ